MGMVIIIVIIMIVEHYYMRIFVLHELHGNKQSHKVRVTTLHYYVPVDEGELGRER